MRIGIMGGTFDPIHYGHLVLAEEARMGFNLKEVIFIPSGHPPHKKDYLVTPAEHRYLMTVLATSNNPYFHTSRMEIERGGPSYAIDTIEEIKKSYKEAEIYFITGLDAILEIFIWRKSADLINICTFIAGSRPGYHLKEIEKKIDKDYLKHITTLEVPALAISSSDIRDRVKRGKPIKYLLPESVEGYIYKHGLYK